MRAMGEKESKRRSEVESSHEWDRREEVERSGIQAEEGEEEGRSDPSRGQEQARVQRERPAWCQCRLEDVRKVRAKRGTSQQEKRVKTKWTRG